MIRGRLSKTPDRLIQGADPKYAYVAGGPIYRDDETGLIPDVSITRKQHPEDGGFSFLLVHWDSPGRWMRV